MSTSSESFPPVILVSIDYEAFNGDDDDSKVISELEYPAAIKEDSDYDVDLVGSCDGLVCLLLDDEEFILWNPSTRESRALPEPSPVLDGTFSYGLGYDFSTDDYNLVKVLCPANVSRENKHLERTFISPNWHTSEWKWDFPKRIITLASKTSGLTKTVVIVSFNLAEEKFQQAVAAPDHLEENNVAVLGILRDCLCLFFECNGNLSEGWLMNEYVVKSPWIRLFSNPVDPSPG